MFRFGSFAVVKLECSGSWACCRRFLAGQPTPCSPGFTIATVIDDAMSITNSGNKGFEFAEKLEVVLSQGKYSMPPEITGEEKALIGMPMAISA